MSGDENEESVWFGQPLKFTSQTPCCHNAPMAVQLAISILVANEMHITKALNIISWCSSLKC